MKNLKSKYFAISLVACLIVFQAQVQAQIPEFKIFPDDSNRDQEFGHSVSVSGNYAVVGAIADDERGVLAGAVYIFKYNGNGWMQTQKLFGNDTDTGDGFGHSVCMNNNRLVVGANIINTGGLANAGAAYVFELNEGVWTQVDKLVADTPTVDARFGTAVSLYEDNLVVGSPGVNSDTGSAYVYTYNNGTMQWEQGDILVDDNSVADDRFGYSVSVYENRVLVGTDTGPFNNVGGYVTIFENLSSLEQSTLSAINASNANRFGFSVGLFADRAIIGAFNDTGIPSSAGSGSAYIFELNSMTMQWEQSQKLAAVDTTGGTDNINFGNAVSINGDRVVVGSFRARPNGSSSGSVFLFEYDGMIWNSTHIPPSDPGSSDQYGFSVALSERLAMVGANFDDNTVQNPNAGSVSLFDVDALFTDSFE